MNDNSLSILGPNFCSLGCSLFLSLSRPRWVYFHNWLENMRECVAIVYRLTTLNNRKCQNSIYEKIFNRNLKLFMQKIFEFSTKLQLSFTNCHTEKLIIIDEFFIIDMCCHSVRNHLISLIQPNYDSLRMILNFAAWLKGLWCW